MMGNGFSDAAHQEFFQTLVSEYLEPSIANRIFMNFAPLVALLTSALPYSCSHRFI
jgi:hypothetical protein